MMFIAFSACMGLSLSSVFLLYSLGSVFQVFAVTAGTFGIMAIAGYTTSIDLLNHVKEVTPDSLNYLIKDMFETITLYQNRVVSSESKKLDNGKYQVDIEFKVSKYRNDEKGKIFYGNEKRDSISYKTEEMKKTEYSVFLADYIDIGIFGKDSEENEIELYLKKHKINSIYNKISIILDEEPVEVGIDPYSKLIDTNSEDNRKKIIKEVL